MDEKSHLLLLLEGSCHEKRWSNLIAMKKSFHSRGIGGNTCLKHWSLKAESWCESMKIRIELEVYLHCDSSSQSEVSLSCQNEIVQFKESLVSLKPYTYFIMFVKRTSIKQNGSSLAHCWEVALFKLLNYSKWIWLATKYLCWKIVML